MPLMAVFITQNIIGATLATVGIAVAIYAVTKSLIQVPLAKRLDSQAGEKDDFFIIFLGGIIGAIYSFGFLFTHQITQLYILEIISGLGDACTMAAYYAIFSHHIDKNSEGFEWSLFSVGGLGLSSALGGVVGGFVSQRFGFPTVFIAAGLLNIVGVFILILLYPYIKILRKSRHYKTIVHEKT